MDNKEAVKRLLLLLGRYKKTIVVIVGCLLVSTGLNLCVPLISRRIMDDGFIGGNKKLLIELVLVSMVIYTINSLIDIVKEKKRVDISAKIQYFLLTFRTFCLMNDRRGQMKIKVCDSCFSISYFISLMSLY